MRMMMMMVMVRDDEGLLDVQPGSEVAGHSSDMIGQSVPASKKTNL